MEPLEVRLAIAGLVVAVLAIGILIFLAIGVVQDLWGVRGENARVHRARESRKRAERRADSEARLTSERLGNADALADEITDMRQRVGAEDRIGQRGRERDRLAEQLARGTPATGAGGGPPAAPARPPGI